MRYWIQIHRQNGDCSAMVPDLPGCVAAGDSVDEVLKLIAEAIAMHLDSMRESREPIPKPTQHVDLQLADLEDGEIHTSKSANRADSCVDANVWGVSSLSSFV